jgi:hypothetical protein
MDPRAHPMLLVTAPTGLDRESLWMASRVVVDGLTNP